MSQVFETVSYDAAHGAAIVRANHILPRLLTAAQAAAYVGYKSTEALKGIPVRPIVVIDDRPAARRWDRKALDLWIDDLSGIGAAKSDDEEDLEAEVVAWEARNGH